MNRYFTISRKIYVFATLLCVAFFTACSKDELQENQSSSNTLRLQFDSRFGDQDFELKKRYPYRTASGTAESDLELSFDRLRYWVSNVKLVKADGSEVAIPESYYLMEETGAITVPHLKQDEQYPATKRDEVTIPHVEAGTYNAIKFSIGVEPKYNDNITLRAGELGLLNGMGFSDGWMWFTSYIFQKLDATMYSGTEAKSLRWDSGSNALYQGAEKSITFPSAITIDQKQGLNVHVKVDVRELLTTSNDPWQNNMITQSTPELMLAFRNALLEKAMQLESATAITE